MKALVLALVSSLAFADPPKDAPLIVQRDGLTCLNEAAVVASERDRAAWKSELREAQVQKAGVLTAVGAIGLVVGLAVGVFVVAPLTKPKP